MRSVVKHSYLRGTDAGVAKAKRHLRYLAFRSAERERTFFGSNRDIVSRREIEAAVDRYQSKAGVIIHKLVLSPGSNLQDMPGYVREIMSNIGSSKGLDLIWFGVVHHNTDHWHAHVIVMPKDENGRRVRFEKLDYRQIKIAGDRYLWRNNLLERKPYKRVARNPHRSMHKFRQRLSSLFTKGGNPGVQRKDHKRLRVKPKAVLREKIIKKKVPTRSKRPFQSWLKMGIGNFSRGFKRHREIVNNKSLKENLDRTFTSWDNLIQE